MKDLEKRIIAQLEELNKESLKYHYVERKKIEEGLRTILKELMEEPVGKMTLEFLNHATLKKYLGDRWCDESVKFRLLIEEYITTSDIALKVEFFAKIENKIKKIRENTFKVNGQGLLPEYISREFIRNIYLSGNKELIELFSKNLPIPSIEVFEGYPVPALIQARTKQATQTVLKFLEMRALKKGKQFGVESEIIGAQRGFRAKRRQKEERERVTGYVFIPKGIEVDKKAFVERTLADANTPYSPQKCSPELARRIFKAAKKVKLFSTVHHLTSESSLENMFNDCLYGRRSLLENYLPFKPAALSKSNLELGFSGDLEEAGGDANTICFGPKYIDPSAIHKDSVDLVFDLDKLEENPCIFYKQRDFGYRPDKIRALSVGKGQHLSFSHTKSLRTGGRSGCINLQILGDSYEKVIAYSELPNYLFMAYDLPGMHQILTLNFFRFLDTLWDADGFLPAQKMIASIYADIEKLDEKELVEFLTELGQQMTDTAEFNFYGAYKIDFSALKTIYSKTSDCRLDLPIFIEELQSGNLEKLKKARENIPNLFKSYRFLDYLLSKIKESAVRKELLELRQAAFVKAPMWMRELNKTGEVRDIRDKPSENLGERLRAAQVRMQVSVKETSSAEKPAIISNPVLLLSNPSVIPSKTGLKSQIRWSRKELTKEEWDVVLSMAWESSPISTGKVQTTQKMTSKEADAFKEKLATAGIDINIMVTMGNYKTGEYQVEIPQEAQLALTELHKESVARQGVDGYQKTSTYGIFS